jgi:putative endonuclease
MRRFWCQDIRLERTKIVIPGERSEGRGPRRLSFRGIRDECLCEFLLPRMSLPPGFPSLAAARLAGNDKRCELCEVWLMKAHRYYVYMLASGRNGTLYIGVTNDLLRRTWEHRNGVAEGFTKKYGVHILVWYEVHGDIATAIAREKQLKGWNRSWKIRLIETDNSGWNDLYDRLQGESILPHRLPPLF